MSETEHTYTSCDDKNLNNYGYNNCRRCTDLVIKEWHNQKTQIIGLQFENESQKAFGFTVRQAAQLTPSEIDITEHFFHSGEAHGRKQALEEAMEICKSIAVGSVDGRLASKTCATKIQELIK